MLTSQRLINVELNPCASRVEILLRNFTTSVAKIYCYYESLIEDLSR